MNVEFMATGTVTEQIYSESEILDYCSYLLLPMESPARFHLASSQPILVLGFLSLLHRHISYIFFLRDFLCQNTTIFDTTRL